VGIRAAQLYLLSHYSLVNCYLPPFLLALHCGLPTWSVNSPSFAIESFERPTLRRCNLFSFTLTKTDPRSLSFPVFSPHQPSASYLVQYLPHPRTFTVYPFLSFHLLYLIDGHRYSIKIDLEKHTQIIQQSSTNNSPLFFLYISLLPQNNTGTRRIQIKHYLNPSTPISPSWSCSCATPRRWLKK
jgi:hypothetical protein